MSRPVFAVVGHPNKGKSSIVATLAEDATVPISPTPGTTVRACRYPLRLDGEVLYELIDTPGFQRPRQVLAWLRARDPAAHRRAETVAAFVDAHRDDARFADECELLAPLIDGAGVLYVVDGSHPYGPEYEAEMEILRWSGRPGMGLINPIRDPRGDASGDPCGTVNFIEDWRRALDQYFAIVRVFDATRADFDKRIALLRGFGELDEGWRPSLERAIDALERERRRRRRQSAVEIADCLIDALTRRVTLSLPEAGHRHQEEQRREEGLERLLDAIRRREESARERIEALYRHAGLTREESATTALDLDPFSEAAWRFFGLSRTQLATTGAVSGAAAGGGIDALLGGASLLLGAGVGAILGGGGAYFGIGRLARIRVLGLPLGGRELLVGPVRDANFPWVMLARAVLHHRLVSERNHARREALVVDARSQERIADGWPSRARGAINTLLTRIRRHGGADRKDRDALEDAIEALLAEVR